MGAAELTITSDPHSPVPGARHALTFKAFSDSVPARLTRRGQFCKELLQRVFVCLKTKCDHVDCGVAPDAREFYPGNKADPLTFAGVEGLPSCDRIVIRNGELPNPSCSSAGQKLTGSQCSIRGKRVCVEVNDQGLYTVGK